MLSERFFLRFSEQCSTFNRLLDSIADRRINAFLAWCDKNNINAGILERFSDLKVIFDNNNLSGVVLICDVDGVLVPGWTNHFNENGQVLRDNLEALSDIARGCDEVVFLTSRIPVSERGSIVPIKVYRQRPTDVVSRFPFITKFMKEQLGFMAGEEKIVFCDGLKKLLSPAKKRAHIDDIATKLKQGKTVVFVGSGMFDESLVKKLLKQCRDNNISLSSFWYYTTGRIIL